MKRFLTVAAVAAALVACNQEQLQQQQKSIDSLNSVMALKDSSMSLIATTLTGIQDNLNYIKEKEGIISVANNENDKEQLKADINAIYAKLVDNKNKVKQLQAKLNASMGKNSEYKKIIGVLQQQIDQQNAQIEKLNQTLNEKDVEIGFLNDAVIKLTANVDSITTVSQNTQATLDNTTTELNTVWYLLADKATLKAKGLLESRKLSGNVDNSLFTKADRTQLSEIKLTGKRFVVLTPHPASSYKIDEESGVLYIKDKKAFWNQSRYLIVQGKNVDEE